MKRVPNPNGRPRGIKETKPRNTLGRRIAEIAAASGKSPLEIMLEHMRTEYEAGHLKEAADRAEAIAPYMHPRLSAATVTHRDALDELSVEQLERLLILAELQRRGVSTDLQRDGSREITSEVVAEETGDPY